MRTAWIGMLALAALSACAVTRSPAVPVDAPATVARSFEYKMTSRHTGREYVVQVSAPIDPLLPGQKIPAIYVLDGNWYFGMATDTVRLHRIGNAMGPAYVVAIGYVDPTFKSIVANRESDLLFNQVEGPLGVMGGGGEAFFAFLTEELQPFVEAHFQIDPRGGVLAGQSLGGVFTTNVLVRHPDSFSAYLIGSPSLWADGAVLAAARRFTTGAGRRVFVAVGGGESPAMRDGTSALAAALSAPTTRLSIIHVELAAHGHTSMAGAWFASGLAYLLPQAE